MTLASFQNTESMKEFNFEVTFGIFLVLVFQISVPERYLDIFCFKISYDQKCKNCDNLGL